MATLPGGAPYPVGTDKVVNGDDAIKALAQYVDRMHAEFDGNTTANPNVVALTGNWVGDSTKSWGNVSTVNGAQLMTVTAGVHSIQASVRFGAAITGRAYGEIQVGGVLVARAVGGNGDDQLSIAVPAIPLVLNNAVTIAVYQTNAAAQSVFVKCRITRWGPRG